MPNGARDPTNRPASHAAMSVLCTKEGLWSTAHWPRGRPRSSRGRVALPALRAPVLLTRGHLLPRERTRPAKATL